MFLSYGNMFVSLPYIPVMEIFIAVLIQPRFY